MYTLNRPWHQSDITNYLACPLLAYFRTYLELEEPGCHPNAVTGSCLHWAIEQWHNENQPLWNRDKINRFIADLFEETVAGHDPMTLLHSKGPAPPVMWEWSKDSQEQLLDKAQECFFMYTCQPDNIEADVLHAELFFRFRYWNIDFEGSIDHIRKMPDGSLELWDFKFSAFTPHPEFLKRDVQFSIYAYALWKGTLYQLDEKSRPIEESAFSLNLVPDRCVWYHLPYLIPYKRNSQYGDKGEIKGDPHYYFDLPRHRIVVYMKNIRRIISQFHRGVFYLAGKQAGACNGFCHYHDACANLVDGLPVDTRRETTAEDFAAIL